jgi:ribosomal protein S18 acetylase RimI-like enzyme
MIRRATRGDLDAIVHLELASFASDRMTGHGIRRLLRSETALFLVAEEEGDIVGCVLLLFRADSRHVRLYSVAVDGRMRGKGLGRQLVAAAEREAASRGADEIRLEVREDNDASRGLFMSSGYLPFRSVPDYYEDGETAVCYRKRLGGRREGCGNA